MSHREPSPSLEAMRDELRALRVALLEREIAVLRAGYDAGPAEHTRAHGKADGMREARAALEAVIAGRRRR